MAALRRFCFSRKAQAPGVQRSRRDQTVFLSQPVQVREVKRQLRTASSTASAAARKGMSIFPS